MLESLGWNIFRIWTLDWIENADVIVESILIKVNELARKVEVPSEEEINPIV